MDRQIKYCTTSDGVSIAYTTSGEGKPLITMPVPGFSHAELSPQMYSTIQSPLAEMFRAVTYDSRGSGLSDRTAVDFSMDAMLKDLDAVIERSGFETFTLASWISTPMAIRYAATHPERVSHLILCDGWANFADVANSPAYQAGLSLLDGDWVLFTETFAQVLWAYQAPEFGRLFAEFIRQCVDQETMRAVWDSWTTYDATEHLSQIAAPTLIVYNKNSRWFGVDVGQRLAAAIPNSRLTLIDDITYTPVPDLIIDFVREGEKTEPATAPSSAGSAFRTILFTDLVGHTEMMSRLGDEKGRTVLREHENISREVLAANGGTEVKTMGDGFMASFNSVAKSIECAIALQRAFDQREGEPLSVRVGINAGEPIEEDGDLFGATVILASRIAAKANGGEILVADTVRGLSSGKGFLFADRGEFVAKGIEDAVRIYEVNWRQ